MIRWIAFGVFLGFFVAPFHSSEAGKTVKFRQYTVMTSGVKIWLPSNIHVKKGDTVEVEIVSKLGKGTIHGYKIKEFGVEKVATDKPQTVRFVAKKAGIFPITCHLHPPHVGGQLIVHE